PYPTPFRSRLLACGSPPPERILSPPAAAAAHPGQAYPSSRPFGTFVPAPRGHATLVRARRVPRSSRLPAVRPQLPQEDGGLSPDQGVGVAQGPLQGPTGRRTDVLQGDAGGGAHIIVGVAQSRDEGRHRGR